MELTEEFRPGKNVSDSAIVGFQQLRPAISVQSLLSLQTGQVRGSWSRRMKSKVGGWRKTQINDVMNIQ